MVVMAMIYVGFYLLKNLKISKLDQDALNTQDAQKDEAIHLCCDCVKPKATPNIAFYVQKTTPIIGNQPVTFDIVYFNKGEGLDGSQGIFTAPVTGIYVFYFSTVMDSSSSASVAMHNCAMA